MTEMSTLRRRMIEDVTVGNLSPATQRSYVHAVAKFGRFFGRSPDRLDLEDVRAFQVHLVAGGISWPALNQTVCALRFLYGVTLRQPELPERIPYAREPQKLPVGLGADEVVRFLEAVSSLKSRAALTTAYAAGLRASEAASLKVGDIDSSRMVVRIEQGKGGRDRYVMLPPQLLGILRSYWRLARPTHWLFPGRDPERPIHPVVLHAACRSACAASRIGKKVTVHTLRHAFRRTHDAHLGRVERRVMAAIEACRTPALGGHVEQCADCGLVRCAYNSCRNRHCPKCQGLARAEWLEARQAELLPVPYFHVVFTLPAPAAEIAFHNKRVVYDILFRAAADALRTVAADPRHLGAEIGAVAVLHTWGQTMQHHPHLHCIVPAGGLSPDGTRWVACRPGFFLPVRVLSRRFREQFLAQLRAAFAAANLRFSGTLAAVAQPATFAARLEALHRIEWVVFAKPPFAGPEPVLAYLGRYTHRVAIANSRLTRLANGQVDFSWKDYRHHGKTKAITLAADEFIRRFLLHTLPDGFHRIRHLGFLANRHRTDKLALCRPLLAAPPPEPPPPLSYRDRYRHLTGEALDICPDCGGPMQERGPLPRRPLPRPPFWCDSS